MRYPSMRQKSLIRKSDKADLGAGFKGKRISAALDIAHDAATRPEPGPSVLPLVHGVLKSPGQRLDWETREVMEDSFGRDFSRVRVHTDPKAARSARALNALAYTVGEDVVLGNDVRAINGPAKLRLMAHELAHVVQQERGGSSSSTRNLEAEAGEASLAVVRGDKPVRVRGASRLCVARQKIVEFEPEQTEELIDFWKERIKTEPDSKKRARYQRYIRNLRQGKRPTGAQAEAEIRHFYEEVGPAKEKAYKHGRQAPRGGPKSKGSTKPDMALPSADFEIKARDITNPKNARNIIATVKKQTTARREGGRAYVKRQPVILDLRGQKVTRPQIDKFVDDLSKVTKIPKSDIQVVVNKGQLKTPTQQAPAAKGKAPIKKTPPLKPIVKPEVEPKVKPKVELKVKPKIQTRIRPKIGLSTGRLAAGMGRGVRVGAGAGIGIVISLLVGWLQSKMEEKQIERDLKGIDPEIQRGVAALAPDVNAYLDVAPGAKLYANITIQLAHITTLDPESGYYTVYGGLKLLSVRFSPDKIDRQVYGGFKMHWMDKWEYTNVTYSVPLQILPSP